VLGQLLAFLGVALLVIVVPGPDTALTVRNALTGGRRCGVATAAGVATGQAVWTIATSVGIAELIQASEPAFLALKLAGAAYLIALGIQSLWTAVRPSPADRWTGVRWPFTGLWIAERTSIPGRLRSPTGGPGTGGSWWPRSGRLAQGGVRARSGPIRCGPVRCGGEGGVATPSGISARGGQ
jgi:hypothetical protein